MINLQFKSYAFCYECDGRSYSFVMIDISEESAKSRVAAMSESSYYGEINQDAPELVVPATGMDNVSMYQCSQMLHSLGMQSNEHTAFELPSSQGKA